MNDQLLIFIDLLQSELEKLVIPDPTTEVARNASVLAARQLRRLLVDNNEVPKLRQEARTSYSALLPQLREVIDGKVCEQLEHVLTTADWRQVEEALHVAVVALLSKNEATSRKLAGQLVAIDAHLRESKELACAELGKPQKSRPGSKNPRSGPEDEEARLLTFIQRQFPKETALKIGRIQQIPGGFSKHTLFIHLENNVELPDCIVMRRDGAYAGSSVTTEYPIIQKMYAAGVAVPQPYAIDAAGEVYGRPFILVSRAAGTTIGDFVVVREPSPAVALDLAKKMARLHTAPFDGIENSLVGGTTSIVERMTAEIEACEATWVSVTHQKSYVVLAAMDWLKRNIHLAEGPRAILHRDIGFHNMLVQDQQVTAFLDWETAAVGTPAEDVGYTYYTVTQMTEWDAFLAAYEHAAGMKLNRQQLDFYILWASVRIVVPISKGVDPVFSGSRKNLSEYYLGDHIAQVLIQRIAAQLAHVLN